MDVILGINGYIWVCKHVKETEQVGEEGFDAESVYSNKNDVSRHPSYPVSSHIYLKFKYWPFCSSTVHRPFNPRSNRPRFQHYQDPSTLLYSNKWCNLDPGLQLDCRERLQTQRSAPRGSSRIANKRARSRLNFTLSISMSLCHTVSIYQDVIHDKYVDVWSIVWELLF